MILPADNCHAAIYTERGCVKIELTHPLSVFLTCILYAGCLMRICHISRFMRSAAQLAMLTKTEMKSARMNPHGLLSIPLTRFMPKSEAMSVGNIMMMVTDVSVRIVVFMLLLMMPRYVSIVDSRMFE